MTVLSSTRMMFQLHILLCQCLYHTVLSPLRSSSYPSDKACTSIINLTKIEIIIINIIKKIMIMILNLRKKHSHEGYSCWNAECNWWNLSLRFCHVVVIWREINKLIQKKLCQCSSITSLKRYQYSSYYLRVLHLYPKTHKSQHQAFPLWVQIQAYA